MKKNYRFIILYFICGVIILFVTVFLISSVKNNEGEDLKKDMSRESKPPVSSQVSTPNAPTEVYILRYNEKENTVELVTKKADGTELISPVESINPFYLTGDDMKALIEGIEVTSREDMFILIEDFSS